MTARGALIEYSSDFFASIPNVVLFQFNPEQLERSIEVPDRPTGPRALEVDQAGDPPTETINVTARFDASDRLGHDDPVARAAGVGPELAALQQMVRPTGMLVGLLGEAVDKIGDLVSGGGGGGETIPVPREQYPRVLFVWGVYRVLPVVIKSLTVTETMFDFLLNPTQAEVQLSMSVIVPNRCSDDLLMQGAAAYSDMARETLAATNLANTVIDQIIDIVSAMEG